MALATAKEEEEEEDHLETTAKGGYLRRERDRTRL